MRMLCAIALGLLVAAAPNRTFATQALARPADSGIAQRPALFLGNDALPPISFMKDGRPSGVVVDLARAIAQRMHRPVEIRLMNWASAQQLVQTGGADALMQINPTQERRCRPAQGHRRRLGGHPAGRDLRSDPGSLAAQGGGLRDPRGAAQAGLAGGCRIPGPGPGPGRGRRPGPGSAAPPPGRRGLARKRRAVPEPGRCDPPALLDGRWRRLGLLVQPALVRIHRHPPRTDGRLGLAVRRRSRRAARSDAGLAGLPPSRRTWWPRPANGKR